MQAGPLRRTPAALAGDDLIGIGHASRGRTRIGWMTPFSRMESVSSDRSSSAKDLRGLSGFARDELDRNRALPPGTPLADGLIGRIADEGRKAASKPGGAGRGSLHLVAHHSLSRRRPDGALALDDLGRQLQIGLGSGAFEIIEQHRLAIGGRFGHAHIPGDDGLIDLRPRNCRTSATTCAARLLRGSNMVITTPWIDSAGFRLPRTCSTVRSNWLRPSSAKNSHCNGTSTASAAAMALIVRRLSDGGQSIRM